MAKYSKGAGQKVTSKKQAIAIGLSEARKKGAKVPPKGASRKAAKKKAAPKKKAGPKKAAKKKSVSKKSAKKS